MSRFLLLIFVMLRSTWAYLPSRPPRIAVLATDILPPRQSCSRIELSKNKDDSEANKARVRFSGVSDSQRATVTNPVDFVISWIASDVGSIVLGLAGVVLLLIGRLILDDDSVVTNSKIAGEATRSNLLAIFACLSILLNGLVKLDVESTTAETVRLEGKLVPSVETGASKSLLPSELLWTFDSLLKATPAESVLLLRQNDPGWTVEACVGVVSWSTEPGISIQVPTPILDRCFKNVGDQIALPETYLPTVQALPGKTEFVYLPINVQALVLLPIRSAPDQNNIVVLGSNRARSFTPKDIAWSQLVVNRMASD